MNDKLILKAKGYFDFVEREFKFITETNKEYVFLDLKTATDYFEGLGYLDIYFSELTLRIPEFPDKTFRFVSKPDPSGTLDSILYCVSPLSKEEAETLNKYIRIGCVWKEEEQPYIT